MGEYMSKIINFGIELPSSCFEHLKEISFYDHNYYKITSYGDWFLWGFRYYLSGLS